MVRILALVLKVYLQVWSGQTEDYKIIICSIKEKEQMQVDSESG